MEVIVNVSFWPEEYEFSLEEIVSNALETHIDSLVLEGVQEDYVEFVYSKNIKIQKVIKSSGFFI